MQRLIIEMGMGVDLHGGDATKAAIRAVEDAMRHSSLPVLKLPGIKDQMEIRVTIGVTDPAAVDTARVAAVLPHGAPVVSAVQGGLAVTSADGAPDHVIAQAAVEVFLPAQSTHKLRDTTG